MVRKRFSAQAIPLYYVNKTVSRTKKRISYLGVIEYSLYPANALIEVLRLRPARQTASSLKMASNNTSIKELAKKLKMGSYG